MTEGPKTTNVLVVDASAVVRQAVALILREAGGFEVQVAADPIIARGMIRLARPDVLLLDLATPREAGSSFLADLMACDPLPVVVYSAAAEKGSRAALEALALGAVDVIAKPKASPGTSPEVHGTDLANALRTAAGARLLRRPRASRATMPSGSDARPRRLELIAIGASTGGPEAILEIVRELPADAPPIAIVQHMPPEFTPAFAARLDDLCPGLRVREARDGARLGRGEAVIAPGGRHLRIVRSGASLAAALDDGVRVNRHRPSVDVLFESVAAAIGRRALGVVLTGMGNDGAAGLLRLRETGAMTIVQEAASCTVFGMPKAAARIGGARQCLGLDGIARMLREYDPPAHAAGAPAGR